MVTNNPRFATLALLNPCDLLGLTVKLLNLPALGTHLLRVRRVILRQIIGSNIVRALGGEHQPEQFHLMAFRKVFDVNEFTLRFFFFAPGQFVYTLMMSGSWRKNDFSAAAKVRHALSLTLTWFTPGRLISEGSSAVAMFTPGWLSRFKQVYKDTVLPDPLCR